MLFESVRYIHCGFSGSLLAIMWHGPVEESGSACLEFYVRVWELQVVELLTIQSSYRTVLNLPSCIVFVCITQWITEQYLVVQNKHLGILNSVNKLVLNTYCLHLTVINSIFSSKPGFLLASDCKQCTVTVQRPRERPGWVVLTKWLLYVRLQSYHSQL